MVSQSEWLFLLVRVHYHVVYTYLALHDSLMAFSGIVLPCSNQLLHFRACNPVSKQTTLCQVRFQKYTAIAKQKTSSKMVTPDRKRIWNIRQAAICGLYMLYEFTKIHFPSHSLPPQKARSLTWHLQPVSSCWSLYVILGTLFPKTSSQRRDEAPTAWSVMREIIAYLSHITLLCTHCKCCLA